MEVKVQLPTSESYSRKLEVEREKASVDPYLPLSPGFSFAYSSNRQLFRSGYKAAVMPNCVVPFAK